MLFRSLGGLALAEVVFGDVNPSGIVDTLLKAVNTRLTLFHGGKLPVSFPRSVGTTPVFYNYIKGSRPIDPGVVFDNGTLLFGHQVGLFIHVRSCTHCSAVVRPRYPRPNLELRPRLELYHL